MTDTIKTFYKNENDYMNSYHWNYLVLELVDYIEEKIKEEKSHPERKPHKNPWLYFIMFCHERGLNRSVIRKMIEFSVGVSFECEADLIRHE